MHVQFCIKRLANCSLLLFFIPNMYLEAKPSESLFVCFKKIQNEQCQPTEITEVPNWILGNEKGPPSLEELKTIPMYEVGFDKKQAFVISKMDKDKVAIETSRGQLVWIPKAQIQEEFSETDFVPCHIQGDKWWKSVYFKKQDEAAVNWGESQDWPISKKNFNSDPIGILEFVSSNKDKICSEDSSSCASSKVKVAKGSFAKDDLVGDIPQPKTLNLGVDHFKGRETSVHEKKITQILVYGMEKLEQRRFRLRAIVYDSPLVWVTMNSTQMASVRFKRITEGEKIDLESFGVESLKGLLKKGADLKVLKQQKLKASTGKEELWFQVELAVSYPDLENRVPFEGRFWVPLHPNLKSCFSEKE